MPRVHHVKAARKGNPVVEAGQPYYWWKFRYGGKHYSTTYPKGSQLTQSEYLGAVRSLVEQRDAFSAADSGEGTPQERVENAKVDANILFEELRSGYEEQAEECRERQYNMPDALQESPTGALLGERAEACDAVSSEIDSAESQLDSVELDTSGIDEAEGEDEVLDATESAVEQAIDEIQTIVNDLYLDEADI
jgi:hypothetical protein